jgi:hypothetical protein
MHHLGLLQASVKCTRLFACVEKTKVSNLSYSRDPRMRLFPPLAPSCTSKGRPNYTNGVNLFKV